jgi:chorismate mutase/prephenate dehydratase
MSSKLDSIRKSLDTVDRAIIEALAEREELIDQISSAKAGRDHGLRDDKREETLLGRIVEQGQEAGLSRDYVLRLFREILDHSLQRQQGYAEPATGSDDDIERVTVAYQGVEGSYSSLAAARHFAGHEGHATFEGCRTFKEVVEAVRASAADYGVLPIENTTAGSINEVYDLVATSDLHVVGEEIQPVEHCLAAVEAVPLAHIRRIYSHPVALAQCSEFLNGLDDVQSIGWHDTATACEKVAADQNLSKAAIASQEAAERCGLHVIKRGISNQKENLTRFLVLANEAVRYDLDADCKTSLLLSTRHEEGALLSCLDVLHRHQLNMCKLESRPRPRTPWEYLFYLDFEGNVEDPNTRKALKELKAHTNFMKVLGSYPARTGRSARTSEPRSGEFRADPVPLGPASLRSLDTMPTLDQAVISALEKKPYKLASRASRAENTVIEVGKVLIGDRNPIVIGGPCSVETREQINACAQQVQEHGAHILRGGCFKPRTSPYSFQGMGYDGLDLLEEAGHSRGLPVITEVLHPSDVAAVAKQADILQVGARNMQNFALLKEVGTADRPVMLKRGMMASIDELLAAAEYILAAGNPRVLLCERGIRTFETATRNTLDLSAVPVLRERTHLPVLVDPSHACGVRRWIIPLAEAAIAAGAHGIMVELHPNPAEALSDGPQALTFDMWATLMKRLQGRVAA